ncbi:MAG: hypothetical protein K9M84_06175 [Spirochaetia bacterium]|nr:hypothetical protein [Spirochaetia bacterium]MCF7941177.1 hypothetical protein [Spirochaetia bacterium]
MRPLLSALTLLILLLQPISAAGSSELSSADLAEVVTQSPEPVSVAAVPGTLLPVPEGQEVPMGYPRSVGVRVPVQQVAVLSPRALPFFEALELDDRIVAVSDYRSVLSRRLVERIDEVAVCPWDTPAALSVLDASSADLIIIDEQMSPRPVLLIPVITLPAAAADPFSRLSTIHLIGSLFGRSEEARIWYDQAHDAYGQLLEWAEHSSREAPQVEYTGEDAVLLSMFTDAGASLRQVSSGTEQQFSFRAAGTSQWYTCDRRLNAHGYADLEHSAVIHPQWLLEDIIRILYTDFEPSELYYIQLQADTDS